ncbi:MAG TPA: ABC transporter permease subunit [Thermomicrobiales bacterium]|nr:ABC transporter permease subunit [Thermomicrobiales bacterium]
MSSVNPVPVVPPERYGEVFDRGYAHYDGPRLGRRQAVRSLVDYSVKRAMGIRKSWTAKVVPFLLYVAVLIPVIAMIGIDALVPDFNFSSYTTYVNWTLVIVGIFVAMAAPEMICVDRRERTLPLYFSRAISRGDYVNAKVIAVTLLTTTMTVLPLVILWLGRQLSADGVWKAIQDNIGDLGRALGVGFLIAGTLGVLGLAVSSLTDRKAVAMTIFIIGFLVLQALAESSVRLLVEDYEWSRYLILISPPQVLLAIASAAFDDATLDPDSLPELVDLNLWVYVAYAIGLMTLCVLFLRWRYSPRDDA